MNEKEPRQEKDRDVQRPMIPLVSKAVAPMLPSTLISRERILRLFQTASRSKFTFVSGVEGSGKTAALVEWHHRLREQGNLVIWFAADRFDADPRHFWLNFYYALKLSLKSQGLSCAHDYDALDSQEALWVLANDLSLLAIDQGDIHIIVEGFDTLEGTPSLEEFLLMATALVSGVHLYLSSRVSYTKHSFPPVRIVESPFEITNKDLMYTKEELGELAGQMLGEALSGADVDLLFKKTLGWPYAAGIALTTARESLDPSAAIHELSGTQDDFWEFFEHEVCDRMDERSLRFLLQMSSARYLGQRFCDYVLDGTRSHILDELSKLNLFVAPFDAKREWFFVHPLFQDWLAEKAKSIPLFEQRRINARAARWCMGHDLPVDGARHQILASECHDVLELARVAFPSLTLQSMTDLISTRHDPLVLEEDPCFCLLAAWAYIFAADVENARLWANRLRASNTEEMPAGVALSLDAIAVKSLCLENNFQEGIALAKALEERLDNRATISLRCLVLNCYAEGYEQQGDIRNGMRCHKEMELLASSCSFDYMQAIGEHEMAYSLFTQGKLKEAMQMCLAMEKSLPKDYPMRGAALALAVRIEAVQGNVADSDERLDEAARVVSRRYNADMYIDWCIARAWVHAAEGDVGKADSFLRQAEDFVCYESFVIPRGVAVAPFTLQAMIGMCQHDREAARTAFRKADLYGVPATFASAVARRGIETWVAKDAGEPTDGVEAACQELRDTGCSLLSLCLDVWLAVEEFEWGSRTKAVKRLHACLALAAKEQVVLPFVFLCVRVRPLLLAYLRTAKPDYERRAFVKALLSRKEFAAVAQEDSEEDADLGLTRQEKRVLQLAVSGLSRDEIANELCISMGTLKSHLSHMYMKFGVNRYRDLLARAVDLGIE